VGHALVGVAASALPAGSLVPLAGLVFQLGATAGGLGNGTAFGQHGSDALFQVLGRTAAYDFALPGTAQVLERALAGQLMLAQPTSDAFDWSGEDAGSDSAWLVLGRPLVPSAAADREFTPPTAPPADAAAEHAALDQAFAQTLDDGEPGGED
jgi:hypothetical protein